MTFARLAVVVLLILSGVLAFYGMVLDRSGQNITFTVIGLLIFGLCLVFVAAWLLSRALGRRTARTDSWRSRRRCGRWALRDRRRHGPGSSVRLRHRHRTLTAHPGRAPRQTDPDAGSGTLPESPAPIV